MRTFYFVGQCNLVFFLSLNYLSLNMISLNLILLPLTKPIIEIVNVVASATIDQKLDLYGIQKKFPAVEYNPDQFPGAVFRLKNPKTATLLFSTGNMVCTGSKSEKLAVKAVNSVVEKLEKVELKSKKMQLLLCKTLYRQ